MGWEFLPDLLIKREPTAPQVELKGDERRQNLKGVFGLNSKIQLPNSVIIFDDVFTTGSTLREAAKSSKEPQRGKSGA